MSSIKWTDFPNLFPSSWTHTHTKPSASSSQLPTRQMKSILLLFFFFFYHSQKKSNRENGLVCVCVCVCVWHSHTYHPPLSGPRVSHLPSTSHWLKPAGEHQQRLGAVRSQKTLFSAFISPSLSSHNRHIRQSHCCCLGWDRQSLTLQLRGDCDLWPLTTSSDTSLIIKWF